MHQATRGRGEEMIQGNREHSAQDQNPGWAGGQDVSSAHVLNCGPGGVRAQKSKNSASLGPILRWQEEGTCHLIHPSQKPL
jgi:hypothetical protein